MTNGEDRLSFAVVIYQHPEFNIVNGTNGKITDDVTDDVTNNVTDNVTNNNRDSRLALILEVLRHDGTTTVEKLASDFMVTRRTILRDLEVLRTQERISRAGSNKGGYWRVIE